MRSHVTLTLACAALFSAGTFAGCTVPVESQDVDENTATTADAFMTRTDPGIYTVRKNTDCKVRLCSGYFVKEVNKSMAERHVDSLAFFDRELETLTLDTGGTIPDGGILLHGFVGLPEGPWAKRPFVVTGAYRGMPGIEVGRHDVFYRVSVMERARVTIAHAVNSDVSEAVVRVDVSRAVMPRVDVGWLEDRVVHHGALVAGHVHGTFTPTKALDVSQVFLHLPDAEPVCAAVHPMCGAGTFAAYTRDVERCLVLDHCASPYACSGSGPFKPAPVVCTEGYLPVGWDADIWGCRDYACEPSFIPR